MQLIGRSVTKTVAVQRGATVLDHALAHEVDFGFSCVRGTCARCRCLVQSGSVGLAEVTDAEWDRLTEEELAQGYRLGCQAVVVDDRVPIVIAHKPYF
ncbi:MAG: 2Fe-2S iron-sulfur cluster binding domain-containing protein [Paenibacillaceae bacterium]|jgi:2Fe-2S ferredoxin|nr:2Fe-2S iron-sulfur cluster binding domain-containing protein [Paenibacillaceae bacterium]